MFVWSLGKLLSGFTVLPEFNLIWLLKIDQFKHLQYFQ